MNNDKDNEMGLESDEEKEKEDVTKSSDEEKKGFDDDPTLENSSISMECSFPKKRKIDDQPRTERKRSKLIR